MVTLVDQGGKIVDDARETVNINIKEAKKTVKRVIKEGKRTVRKTVKPL